LPLSPLGASPALGVDFVADVDVVAVDVVGAAAVSALVSLGGVMSGVLFGTASATLPAPPQPASASDASSAPHAAT
jgi:hypothetical protein